MAGVNKAILIGNLGQDPEIRYFQDGTPVANFSIATSETWNDKNTGEKREKTEWHRIVAFRRLAEICGQYLSKGRQVYIEGKIQTREWEDREGIKRYTTEIVASSMQMLGTRADAGQQGGYQQSGYQQGPQYGGYQSGPQQGGYQQGGYQGAPGYPPQQGGYQGGYGGGYQQNPPQQSSYQGEPRQETGYSPETDHSTGIDNYQENTIPNDKNQTVDNEPVDNGNYNNNKAEDNLPDDDDIPF